YRRGGIVIRRNELSTNSYENRCRVPVGPLGAVGSLCTRAGAILGLAVERGFPKEIFGMNGKLITNDAPSVALELPKVILVKKDYCTPWTSEVIYTSYLFSETTNYAAAMLPGKNFFGVATEFYLNCYNICSYYLQDGRPSSVQGPDLENQNSLDSGECRDEKFGEWSSASELAIISEDGRGHGRAL
ncbi:zinc finger protein 423, partial [Vespula squamosa]